MGGGVPLERLQVSVVEDLYIKQVTHSLVVVQVEAVVQTCVRREKYDQDGEKKRRDDMMETDFQVLTICRHQFFNQVNGAYRLKKMFKIPNITPLTIQMKGGKICDNRCSFGPEPSV